MRVASISAALLAGTLAGCSLTPELTRPEAPVSDTYEMGAAPSEASMTDTGQGGPRAVEIGWRDFFQDDRLQTLIDLALENNRDLRRAALAIQQARAQYNIEAADELPSLDGTTQVTRSRTPTGTLLPGATGAITTTDYRVGLAVTAYELDFFGRVRNLSDAALAEYLATEEARLAAQISLIGEVATAYLAERAAAEQLTLARQTLEARRNALDLARQRYEAGAASALDLRQAETLVASARVSVAALVRQHALAVNTLTLLVGTSLPGNLPEPLSLTVEQTISNIPAGLPSDLLVQRPDIRAAEQQLVSANAVIGAARAAFFPRISLTASAGTASTELSDLFDGNSRTWTFAPQLVLPIFNAGLNRANLDLAEVRKNLAVVEYEQTIQQAFREVADALAARNALTEQVEAQQALLEAQAARLTLAEQRYEGGVVSFLEVLDARRELFDAEQALVQTRQLRLTNAVDLYIALGGGWSAESVTDPFAAARERMQSRTISAPGS